LAVIVIGGAGYLGILVATPQQEAAAGADAPVTVVVTKGTVKQTVTAPGELSWTWPVDLSMGASGQVAEIHARAGDRVATSDVLVQLDTGALERAVALAELGLRQAQLRLEQLQEPPDEEDVRRAEHAVDQAVGTLEVARLNLTTIQNSTLLNEALEDAQEVYAEKLHVYETRLAWYESGEEPDYWFVDDAKEDLDDARLNLDRIQQQGSTQLQNGLNAVTQAQQSYQEAVDALNRLLEGADPLDVEAAQLDVEAAQLVLDEACDNLVSASLMAPSDGVILDVSIIPGQRVSEGVAVIRMADPGALELYATIIEEDYVMIAVGQPVDVFFDAMPEQAIRGHIARIVPEKIEDERPLYAIHVELEEVPASLAEGMTADAEIIIDEQEDVLRLPRSLVKARSDGTADVVLWRNGQQVERSIRVGLRGDVYIEILESLQEGDLVIGR
jgi:HlyD family secretion protein